MIALCLLETKRHVLGMQEYYSLTTPLHADKDTYWGFVFIRVFFGTALAALHCTSLDHGIGSFPFFRNDQEVSSFPNAVESAGYFFIYLFSFAL